jgi:hypothetical protein
VKTALNPDGRLVSLRICDPLRRASTNVLDHVRAAPEAYSDSCDQTIGMGARDIAHAEPLDLQAFRLGDGSNVPSASSLRRPASSAPRRRPVEQPGREGGRAPNAESGARVGV